MKITAKQTLDLARKHIGNGAAMDSSARLCLADAVAAHDRGDLDRAADRAIASLRYSVGMFHGDFHKASKVFSR